MTLVEVTNLLEYIAKNQPNINTVVGSGDIFDLNKENYQVRYSAFCATQRTHTFDENFVTFNFTLYYVDRLTTDLRNKIEVQSTAVDTLTNIYKTIKNNVSFLEINAGEIVTFTEKFTAECAGAYMNVGIITSYESLCAIVKQEFGEFAPEPYSDDWFKWVVKRLY